MVHRTLCVETTTIAHPKKASKRVSLRTTPNGARGDRREIVVDDQATAVRVCASGINAATGLMANGATVLKIVLPCRTGTESVGREAEATSAATGVRELLVDAITTAKATNAKMISVTKYLASITLGWCHRRASSKSAQQKKTEERACIYTVRRNVCGTKMCVSTTATLWTIFFKKTILFLCFIQGQYITRIHGNYGHNQYDR